MSTLLISNNIILSNCRCRPVAHIDKTKKEALKKRVADLKAQAEAEKAAGPGPGLAAAPSVQPTNQAKARLQMGDRRQMLYLRAVGVLGFEL